MAFRSLWARTASRYRPYVPYLKYPLIAATWVPVFIWFTTNIAETTTINGASMTPFFNDRYNQSLKRDLCLNLKYRGAREKLQRGMIVTFRYSVCFYSCSLFVKRGLVYTS
jgi:mitochondrial inner membrane protease subunit 2